MSEEVEVEVFPPCSIHFERLHETIDARYDAKTIWGAWAYLCSACYKNHAMYPDKLGTGYGQRLVLRRKKN